MKHVRCYAVKMLRSECSFKKYILVLLFMPLLELTQALRSRDSSAEGRILNRRPYLQKEQSVLLPESCSEMFCQVDDAYPVELVNSAVARDFAIVDQMYKMLYRHVVEELILMENVTESYRLKGNFACESDVTWVKVGWARDISGRLLLIINTPRFPQIHRIEACRYFDKPCEYLPPCYKSRCQQRYTLQHLLAVDPSQVSNGPFIELFRLPSSCSCFVENFVYY